MARLSNIQLGLATFGQAIGINTFNPQQKRTDNDLNAILYGQLVNHQAVVFYNYSREDYISKGYQSNAEVYTIVNKIVSKTIAAPCYLYIDKEDQKSAKYKKYRQYKKNAGSDKHSLNRLYVAKALEYAPETSDLARLLKNPNPNQSWAEMMELFDIFYFVQGEAFLYRETAEDSDIALNLNVAPANLMTPIFGGDYDDVITGWTLDMLNGENRKLDAKDVFQLKMANPMFDQYGGQLRGQSPLMAGLKYLCQSNEGVKAWANSLANEGAKGIISPNHADPKLWLNPEQVKATQAGVDEKVNGAQNKNKVMTSGMPLQYTAIGLSPEALNIIEGLKYAGVKLANLWNVPAVLFEEDPTYQNKKEARKEFVSDVVLPYHLKKEDALNRWLVEPFIKRDKKAYVLDYDTSQYEELKPSKEDIEAFKEFCTINEIRIIQGFDEIEDDYANQIFIPQGKIPLSDYSAGMDLEMDPVAKSVDFNDTSFITKAEILKGCLMFYPDIDINDWVNGIRKLVPSHIVEEYEFEPHLTILYGFDDNLMDTDRLKAIVNAYLSEYPIRIKADTIGLFSNEMDVIKIEVEDLNGNLTRLNSLVKSEFPYQNDYPTYKPHVTIAYAKKGTGTYLDGAHIDLKEYGLKDLNTGVLRYSDSNKNKTVI